jgi:hypothetical protein
MAKKQPSGAENRKRARARLEAAAAAGVLMPPIPSLDDVSSLTAITSTRHGAFCEWIRKRISTDDFAVFLKALAEFRSDAVARITEREIANDERMTAALEAHEARVSGLTLMQAPALEQAPAPVDGELMPREKKTEGVSE